MVFLHPYVPYGTDVKYDGGRIESHTESYTDTESYEEKTYNEIDTNSYKNSYNKPNNEPIESQILKLNKIHDENELSKRLEEDCLTYRKTMFKFGKHYHLLSIKHFFIHLSIFYIFLIYDVIYDMNPSLIPICLMLDSLIFFLLFIENCMNTTHSGKFLFRLYKMIKLLNISSIIMNITVIFVEFLRGYYQNFSKEINIMIIDNSTHTVFVIGTWILFVILRVILRVSYHCSCDDNNLRYFLNDFKQYFKYKSPQILYVDDVIRIELDKHLPHVLTDIVCDYRIKYTEKYKSDIRDFGRQTHRPNKLYNNPC